MDHRYFLERALLEAIQAQKEGQIPVGCVIVDRSGNIIARGRNQVRGGPLGSPWLNDPTAHAEMMAIRSVVSQMDGDSARSWTLYSTLEPCPMCLGTIIMCHIGTVVWAAPDRRIETHKLLLANPYMQTRKLVTIACPYPDLEQRCSEIHDAYWISKGRPGALRPIDA